MKCKVIFFLPNLTVGGAEQVTLNFIKSLDKSKFEVILVVISNEWDCIEELPLDIEIVRLGISRTIKSIFKISTYIKEEKPDIIFTSLIHSSIALYLSMLGMRKKPKIILRSPTSPKLLIEAKKIGKLRKFFLMKSYKSADVVLAQTPEMKDEIIHYYKINSDKVKVLINPLDRIMIDQKITDISNPFDINKENIVASGRLVKEKGFDVLIKAFSLILEKNRNFELYILGSEMEEGDTLRALVSTLNLEKKVHFLGHQTNPYRYYYFSNLYVLSSRREGLPNTVLENLYLNKPIIATRCIPFMEKLLNDGENGFLVNVEDEKSLAEKILAYKVLVPDDTFVRQQKNEINEIMGEINGF